MSWPSRAVTALVEDLDSFPAPTKLLTPQGSPFVTPVPGRSSALFWLQQTLLVCGRQTGMQAKHSYTEIV